MLNIKDSSLSLSSVTITFLQINEDENINYDENNPLFIISNKTFVICRIVKFQLKAKRELTFHNWVGF